MKGTGMLIYRTKRTGTRKLIKRVRMDIFAGVIAALFTLIPPAGAGDTGATPPVELKDVTRFENVALEMKWEAPVKDINFHRFYEVPEIGTMYGINPNENETLDQTRLAPAAYKCVDLPGYIFIEIRFNEMPGARSYDSLAAVYLPKYDRYDAEEHRIFAHLKPYFREFPVYPDFIQKMTDIYAVASRLDSPTDLENAAYTTLDIFYWYYLADCISFEFAPPRQGVYIFADPAAFVETAVYLKTKEGRGPKSDGNTPLILNLLPKGNIKAEDTDKGVPEYFFYTWDTEACRLLFWYFTKDDNGHLVFKEFLVGYL